MTYYTITTDHGEYTGQLLTTVPAEVEALFGFHGSVVPDKIEPGIAYAIDSAKMVGLMTSDPQLSSGEEIVYLRRSDIRSVVTTSDAIEATSPAVGDSPLADDAHRE